MSTVHAPARRVRWFNYLAYGSNDVLGAGSMAVTSTWILLFYTSLTVFLAEPPAEVSDSMTWT